MVEVRGIIIIGCIADSLPCDFELDLASQESQKRYEGSNSANIFIVPQYTYISES